MPDVVHDNVVDLPIAIRAFQHIDDRNLIAIFGNHLGIDFSVVLAHGLAQFQETSQSLYCYSLPGHKPPPLPKKSQ